ncbi:MAG: hypothetical protein QW334_00180 [Thermofilum sp.]
MSLLQRIFSRRREDVGVVAGASETVLGKYPDPGFSVMVEYYRRDPVVRAAVDDLAERSVGMGFFTTSSAVRHKEIVDEFNEKVDLDSLNLEIARHCFAFGNCFVEKVYDKYVERKTPWGTVKTPAPRAALVTLKMLPVSSFTRVYTDEYGTVHAYEQRIGGVVNLLSPEILIHFRINCVDARPFGLGLVETLCLPGVGFYRKSRKTGGEEFIQRPGFLQVKEEYENIIRDFLRRYIGRYAFIWKGEDTEKVKEYIAVLKRMQENEDIGVGLREGAELQITPLSIDPRARLDPILSYLENQIISGIQTPVVKLFTTPGFTQASARAAQEVSERKIAAFQRYLKRKIEREVFAEVQLRNGLNPMVGNVRLNWGVQEAPKLELRDLIELAKISAETGMSFIRAEELRKNLVKFGIELWEPEKPEEAEG